MKRLLIFPLSALLAFVALDGHADDFRKMAEASMLVKGTVDINPDGSLRGYTIDRAETLAPPVIAVIEKNVPAWKFRLTHASTTAVKETMTLRLVAKAVDDAHDSISIAAATFGNPDPDDEHVRFKSRKAPHYPREAVEARVSGTVYLLARVGPNGRVQNVSAEQVNLRTLTDKPLMDRYRKDLANAAIAAAKDWTYEVPTKGEHVNDPYWYVRTPINFYVVGSPSEPNGTASKYGKWEVYIPGPKQDVPWIQDRSLLSDAPDAIPEGALQQLGSGTRLSTSLSSG
jgi:hypothetical protein